MKAGRTKWATIDADTTSAALAQAAGDAYLAEVGNLETYGQITVSTTIAGIQPWEWEAGDLIVVQDPERGAITARVREVQGQGLFATTLMLNDTSDAGELVQRLVYLTKQRRTAR